MLAAVLALWGAVPAAAENDPAACVRIDQITAFAPRGEVYVEVQADCRPEHFLADDPIIAYLEVLVSDLPAVGEDVRIHGKAPKGRDTYSFRDLEIASGDIILVRLLRFGEILGIRSVKVP